MGLSELAGVLRHQCGVVSRRQVLVVGGCDSDIERMLRRRELARVFEGVYVDHTGPLTEEQQAWAAVLYAGPSALAGRSALRAHGSGGSSARPVSPYTWWCRAIDASPVRTGSASSGSVASTTMCS